MITTSWGVVRCFVPSYVKRDGYIDKHIVYNMGVSLSGFYAFVPRQFLYVANVLSFFEQVDGKAAPVKGRFLLFRILF